MIEPTTIGSTREDVAAHPALRGVDPELPPDGEALPDHVAPGCPAPRPGCRPPRAGSGSPSPACAGPPAAPGRPGPACVSSNGRPKRCSSKVRRNSLGDRLLGLVGDDLDPGADRMARPDGPAQQVDRVGERLLERVAAAGPAAGGRTVSGRTRRRPPRLMTASAKMPREPPWRTRIRRARPTVMSRKVPQAPGHRRPARSVVSTAANAGDPSASVSSGPAIRRWDPDQRVLARRRTPPSSWTLRSWRLHRPGRGRAPGTTRRSSASETVPSATAEEGGERRAPGLSAVRFTGGPP